MADAGFYVARRTISTRIPLRISGGFRIPTAFAFLGLAGMAPLAASSTTIMPGLNSASRPEAACLVVIHHSSDSQWPDPGTLSALLQSSGVADVPAGEILGIAPELRAQKVHFQITPSMMPGELTLSVRVALDLPQDVPFNLARAYLGAVIDRFKDALADLRDGRSLQCDHEIKESTEELEATEKERTRVQTTLREIDTRVGVQNSDLRCSPAQTQFQIMAAMTFLKSYRDQEELEGKTRDHDEAQEAWRHLATLLEEAATDLRRLLEEGKLDSDLVARFEGRLEEARAHAPLPTPGLAPGKGQMILAPGGAIGVGPTPILSPGGAIGVGPTAKKLSAERMEELERLLDKMREFEKIDVRALAIEKEDYEKREQKLREKRNALTAQIDKLKSEMQNLSSVSVETVGK